MRLAFIIGLGSLLLAASAVACDLCSPQGAPLSFEVAQARMVVYGPIINARLGSDGTSGTSELRIEEIVKGTEQLKGQRTITLPRYVPPDPQNKLKFVIFLDVVKGQLDAYRGLPVTTPNIVKYLRGAPVVDPQAKPDEKAKRLLYYFQYLNDLEPEVAADAFKEFATATNQEIGLIGRQLSADQLRTWLLDRKTPPNRLGLYAYLLGACGKEDRDADLLREFIRHPEPRTSGALDGFLAGYIRLRPQDGWKLTLETLQDPKRDFTQRHSILRLLRFYHGSEPDASRAQVVKAAAVMLQLPDMMDLAIDQLRQWQVWSLTDQVLALWGQKETDAPITKRALVRYAFACPQPVAKKFLAEVRRQDPLLVKDIEELLSSETPTKP